MEDADFLFLIERARNGDGEATAALLGTFEREVRLMVRARLPKALRSRFDSMDFVQAIWQSVFTGETPGPDFANMGHFRGYLAGVARNKVFDAYRRNTSTQKINLLREEPLYVRRNGQDTPRDLPGRDPTPSQVVQADECWDRLLAGPSPQDAEIVKLRRSGLTFDEIARRTGVSERSVRRVIEAAKRRIEGG